MPGLLLRQTSRERAMTMAVYKRSEESLLSFQAIEGRSVKERCQGFLTALASPAVTPYGLVALASGQTAKHRRFVRNDMRR